MTLYFEYEKSLWRRILCIYIFIAFYIYVYMMSITKNEKLKKNYNARG